MIKKCLHCKNEFKARYKKTKYCGRECQVHWYEHYSDKQKIDWANRQKKRADSYWKNPENIKEMKRKRCIREYVLISPTGKEFKVTNCNEFCKEHKLTLPNMWMVFTGIYKHHKGWTGYIVGQKNEVHVEKVEKQFNPHKLSTFCNKKKIDYNEMVLEKESDDWELISEVPQERKYNERKYQGK